MQLQQDTLLQGGKYTIESVLDESDFAITYLAVQTVLNKRVVVKEFFIKELCGRDAETSHVDAVSLDGAENFHRYRSEFLKNAQAVAALEHQHIARINDLFEENDTAYCVMDYCSKGSLADAVKQRGALPEADAIRCICEAGNALDYLQQRGLPHRSVNLGNLLINDAGSVLIDFCMPELEPKAGDAAIVPSENSNSQAADVRTLAAMLYAMLTAEALPEAGEAPSLPQEFSPSLRSAVEQALQSDSPLTIAAFLAAVGEKTSNAEKGQGGKRGDAKSGYRDKNDADSQTDRSLGCIIKSIGCLGGGGCLLYAFFLFIGYFGVLFIGDVVIGTAGGFLSTIASFIDAVEENNQKAEISINDTIYGADVVPNGVPFKVIKVEGDTFTMGDTKEQGNNLIDDAVPVHKVTLDDCQTFIKKLNDITGKTFR